MMSGITQQHTNQQKSTILGNMDNLWFHEAIIFSQPIGVSSTMISSQTDKTLINPNTSTITTSSSSLSSDDQEMMVQQLDVEQEEALTSGVSLISISQEGDFDVVTEEEDGEIEEIPVTPTSDSNSSNSTTSSSTHRHHRRRRTRIPQLDRTLSSKTFEELEEEEVKGFMDLGFNFEKNRLTPRMMSILPGLQRLQQDDDDNQDKNDDDDTTSTDDQSSETTPGTGKLKSRRPYLSESWSIERPDSPLLRMRMPTAFSAPDDMKRLLKVWVKTVAVAVRD